MTDYAKYDPSRSAEMQAAGYVWQTWETGGGYVWHPLVENPQVVRLCDADIERIARAVVRMLKETPHE